MRRSRRLANERELPWWVSGLAVGGTLAALMIAERRRPLRNATESKPRREARNFAVAGLAAAAMQVAERPVTSRLTRWVEQKHIGLLKQFSLPPALETTVACLLLDYTLYIWHVLTHKLPLLWRFHRAHHADLDLDTSTALRFHFGEIMLSVGWRAGQIVLIGVSPRALSIWYTLLLVEVMFHHSNLELPPRLERWLRLLIVTPRMHGIHHSVLPEEVDSNWSSGLTVWDYLHRTLRLGTPQGQITIGVPELRHPSQVTLPRIIAMPFEPPGRAPAKDQRVAGSGLATLSPAGPNDVSFKRVRTR